MYVVKIPPQIHLYLTVQDDTLDIYFYFIFYESVIVWKMNIIANVIIVFFAIKTHCFASDKLYIRWYRLNNINKSFISPIRIEELK